MRLALGGLAAGVTAVALAIIAAPSAAVGPGGGAILWAENTNALPMALLAVALLRAAATTAAVAAGGCGGVFVPFLAIGDLAGRVFAPGLGVGNDLAGSSGAAAGIAGGYRLPFTAVAMVLGDRRSAPGDADLPGHGGRRVLRRRGGGVAARRLRGVRTSDGAPQRTEPRSSPRAHGRRRPIGSSNGEICRRLRHKALV